MRVLAALLLLLAAACSREAAPEAHPTQAPRPAGVNLLELQHGASVISRTGEYWYEATAAHALDRANPTAWVSPIGGPEQTIVVALAARSRIRDVGVTRQGKSPHQVRVESSLDGSQWSPVTVLTLDPASDKPQMRTVAPFEAQYLRFRTIAPGEEFSEIREFHAHGEELEAPKPGSIEGCWTINGRAARFVQRGAQVQGVIERTDRLQETQLDGGFDGRAYRFMWRAAAQVGDAIVTVSPDGKAISGVSRHKGSRHELPGEGWLGTPGPCPATTIDADSVRARALEVIRRYPMYGLRFDERDRLLVGESAAALQFIAALKNVRLVAREHPARLTSLRDALAAGGVDVSGYQLVDGTAAQAKLRPTFYAPNIEIELR